MPSASYVSSSSSSTLNEIEAAAVTATAAVPITIFFASSPHSDCDDDGSSSSDEIFTRPDEEKVGTGVERSDTEIQVMIYIDQVKYLCIPLARQGYSVHVYFNMKDNGLQLAGEMSGGRGSRMRTPVYHVSGYLPPSLPYLLRDQRSTYGRGFNQADCRYHHARFPDTDLIAWRAMSMYISAAEATNMAEREEEAVNRDLSG